MGTVIAISGVAGLASVVGGLIAFARTPTSLMMSVVFGLASGVLIGTVTLEMLPEAIDLAPLGAVVGGFAAGFLMVWVFDLFINRWHLAGEHAAQYARVRAYHRAHRPRGDRVTVLAGGTSAEELIEGLAIGAGVAVEPEVGVLIAAAIAVDNLSEGMSIGEFVAGSRATAPAGGRALKRTIGWTGLVGACLFVAACAGWLLMRDVEPGLLGFLLATGGGGMLYLTVSALVPPAEETQFQGSGALATGLGFLIILLLTAGG